MPNLLLSTELLTKRFGGVMANDAVNLEIEAGKLHAIIGPNGAGKTTLVAQLSGEIRPDSGSIVFAGQDVTRLPVHLRSQRGIARSFQVTSIIGQVTALDNVALAVQAHDGHSFRFWSPARLDPVLRDPARAILEHVGLHASCNNVAANLAHGEKRALDIAMALATRPRLLILDEPMAGMGPGETAQMVRLLAELKQRVTILLIEHDMDTVFALADRITVLVYGRVIASGPPTEIRANVDVRRAYLGEECVP